MASAVLSNQLKSLNDACHELQQRVGDDARAAQLLYCIRGLITQLTVDNETAPQLTTKARDAFAHLQPAIEKLIGAVDTQRELAVLMQDTHARLTAQGSATALALCKQLSAICLSRRSFFAEFSASSRRFSSISRRSRKASALVRSFSSSCVAEVSCRTAFCASAQRER